MTLGVAEVFDSVAARTPNTYLSGRPSLNPRAALEGRAANGTSKLKPVTVPHKVASREVWRIFTRVFRLYPGPLKCIKAKFHLISNMQGASRE